MFTSNCKQNAGLAACCTESQTVAQVLGQTEGGLLRCCDLGVPSPTPAQACSS